MTDERPSSPRLPCKSRGSIASSSESPRSVEVVADQSFVQGAWLLDAGTVLARLGVDPAVGLSSVEAANRLERFGSNQLVAANNPSPVALFLRQFVNAMVLVLIVAAVVTSITGETTDTIVIGAIVLLNGVVGFIQEYRAQRALEALRNLEADQVTIRRDGESISVLAASVVLGDIVELATGDLVAADLRLTETRGLRIAQAALTGESESTLKDAATIDDPEVCPIADQHNMAFKGTAVTFGRGVGVAVATGTRTELGRIADLLTVRNELPTPLQRRLNSLARTLSVGAVLVCVLVFLVGLARGEPVREMFITAVSLAVAAIPESLPAVITVALALGARRMAERRTLIRKLVTVETLGSVDVICTDKTGTLTQNRMVVERVWTPRDEYRVTGDGYAPDGALVGGTDPAHDPFTQRLATVAALCNDARLQAPHEVGDPWLLSGDPTEGALLALAGKLDVEPSAMREQLPRVEELPFDAERRRMTTLHHGSGEYRVVCKGALESLTPLLSDEIDVLRAARVVGERWAHEGLRVLALADRSVDHSPDELEQHLGLVGLVGITDPPRAEAADALAQCRVAGIRAIIITGDHPSTAAAVARRIGLRILDSQILSGAELAKIDDAALVERVPEVTIYARVSPAEKLRIVGAWQRRGSVVAMTGDGVNDAPALRRADIGVAMGITGTDVSKEAADMVLADDNFATIVSAVEEGRRIYDNIRRVIRYLLSTNAGELWVMFLAPLIGLPIPLLAVQILWMNLVTDGLPAIALGLEPVELDAMRRPPRRRDETLFAGGLWQHVMWVGLLMAVIVLAMEVVERRLGGHWRTMVFTTLALLQLGHSLAVRSERRSTFTLALSTNPWLYVGVTMTMVAQLLVVYLAPLQRIFHTASLSAGELATVVAASTVVFFAVEVEKWILRRRPIRIPERLEREGNSPNRDDALN